MPWCTTCDRFLSPSTVLVNGTCPSCGRTVDAGRAHAATALDGPAPDGSDDDAAVPVPWHLKLLLVALAIYLAYRLYQGAAWLIARL